MPLALAAFLAATACSSEHTPVAMDTGTETGNAPIVLRPELLSLTPVAGGVELRGEPGATSAGATVAVTALAEGDTYTTVAAADGSFALTIPGGADEVSVQVALDGRTREARVAVETRATATNALGCEQRRAAVQREIVAAVAAADTGCTSDADCTWVATSSACTSSCSDGPVSTRGAASIDATIAELGDGACAAYDEAGCSAPAPQPCPAPPNVACDRGTCVAVPSELAASCALPFDAGSGDGSEAVYWYDAASHTCLPRFYRGQGGNGNRAASRELCEAACLTDAACPRIARQRKTCAPGPAARWASARSIRTCAAP
jgi:Kunitz/Bovine pancreatic trypsin inhibitor domain